MKFTDYLSQIQLPDCSKLTIILKNGNDVTIFRHDVFVKFFWRCFVSLVKFSCWSKFHVNININTGSGVMIISFYKGLTRNPAIRNTPPSGDRGKQGIPNLAWTPLIKCYWMLQNARVTPFTVSELLRKNQLGGFTFTFRPKSNT